MPFSRPCIGAGAPCPTRSLTTHRSGRCEICRRQHWARLRATTRTGNNSQRWKTMRAQVIAAEPVCHWCHEKPSTEADHVIPMAIAPELEFERSNLVGACTTCNRSRGSRPAPDA
jgi:5-methylcytosine-specific restriction endonuclease McrA